MAGMEVQVHTILTSELDGPINKVHSPATLAPSTYWIGDRWVPQQARTLGIKPRCSYPAVCSV